MTRERGRGAGPDAARRDGGTRPVEGGELHPSGLPPGRAAKIRFEERGDYLHASVWGEKDTLEVSLDYWTRVIEECERVGQGRVLVEESFDNQLPTVDMFELCARVAELAAARALKIAFVDREISHQQLNEFGGTVAANRGVSVRVFASVAEAEPWISGSTTSARV